MTIITPVCGQELTDLALHFVWEPDQEAKKYEILMSQDADFENCRKIEVPRHEGCQVDFYLPRDEELPGAGDWNVKIRSDAGKETEAILIHVNTEHGKAPLRTEISPEHPHITIFDYSEHDYGAEYDILPEDLKPYVAIRGGGAYRVSPDKLAASMLEGDRKGYPWYMGSCGPKEVHKGKYVVTPLSIIEYVFQRAENLKSVGALEIYMGVRKAGDWHIPYLNRLIKLCGKYGYPFLYTDGNRNEIDLAAVIKRADYMDTIREYGDYVVMSYKQNHANASYSCYGAILGAWLEGAIKRVGVQAENWYWNDAGFCDDIGHYHGYLQGNEQQIPATFTAQMLLPGVSYGASYYSLEGEGWLIRDKNNGDYEFSPQGIAVLSMLRTIIRRKLIPSREEVTEKIKAVITTEGTAEDWGDAWTGGVFRNAFQNLYGIVHAKELFPKQLRYFYLPWMTNRPEAFEGYEKIRAQEIQDPDKMNAILDPLYPKWFEGNAYVTNTGGTCIIMNSNENTDGAQYYHVPVESMDEEASPVAAVEGAIGLWQYFILYSRGGETFVHANAPKDTILKISFRTAQERKLRMSAAGEGLKGKWDPATERYVVTITGSDSPVEFVLSTKEAISETVCPPLANEPDGAVYLTDLKPVAIQASDKGMPAFGHCANTRYGILPIAMNSIRYEHGISMPRETQISWKLGGKYDHLRATLGFDIDCWMPIIVDRIHIVWDRYVKEISFRFMVYGDDRLIYQSPELKSTSFREVVDIDVKGVDHLMIRTEGSIFTKPLVGALTGRTGEFELDVTTMKEEDRPSIEVYLDLGNPVLTENPSAR